MIELFGYAGLAVATAGQALLRRWPSLQKSAAPTPTLQAQSPTTPLDVKPAQPTSQVQQERERRVFELDERTGRVALARRPRARRADVSKEKILALFVEFMSGEDEFCGWYTSAQIYEEFREFTWQERLEELDRGTFLSMLAVEIGVVKRRAYVQKNDTYRHLRQCVHGQQRAVVYRMPNGEELAAARHKRALKDGGGGPRMTMPKVRLDPGGHKQARALRHSSKDRDINNLGMDAPVYGVAA